MHIPKWLISGGLYGFVIGTCLQLVYKAGGGAGNVLLTWQGWIALISLVFVGNFISHFHD